MNPKISIILIDDHTLFRSGIKALLARQADCEVVGEAADGLSGVKLVEQHKPDVVLLDLDMPVMNGREALAQILSSQPQQTVVMLTVSEDSEDLTECMRLGARGFLLKNINADFLVDAIKKAANGDNVFSPEMTARLVQSLIQPQAAAPTSVLDSLTPRELEILGHLAAGHSNKIIARKLDLAESTIKVHVQNILRKLELSSRVQAAVFAVQHKVPQPQD
ncbi:response regulator [Paralysiella testudinis]|jgi:two-component system nitrate/nitrite response regulator NarL|uniref:Response regulator transcription factor n=1 Tax=Paralysiella testudinis TaxID=2809020 RepID=A0A892ZCY4_9NEIS|nr:response regulator transcription factor [Paralysiella testudinis]QRQ81175.1 response regulator transcription factor [Paralysiella testudinis]